MALLSVNGHYAAARVEKNWVTRAGIRNSKGIACCVMSGITVSFQNSILENPIRELAGKGALSFVEP